MPSSRKVMVLEIEEAALTKEKDLASMERLRTLRGEPVMQVQRASRTESRYESEKEGLFCCTFPEGAYRIREEGDRKSEREYDLNRAAELKHGTFPQPESFSLREREASIKPEGQAAISARSGKRDFEIVSKWTGIPVDETSRARKKNC